MEGSLHAILLLGTIPMGAWLCWRYRGMPLRRWHIAPRVALALVNLVIVWMFSAGMFQCLCGPGNNPSTQGWIPALMAATAIVFIRDWKPKLVTVLLMVAVGYGLSWHFHDLALGEDHEARGYMGSNDFDGNPPEAELWHTSFTGIRRYIPPPPKETALHVASRENDVAKAKALLKTIPVDEANRDGETPLQVASARGALEVVRVLLDAGAKVDKTDRARETPLHYASIGGSVEVAKLLLARGAVVNARSTNGATPFSHAASKGRIEVMELLLAHGANMELKESRFSPLELAIRHGHKAAARFLIGKGAGVTSEELMAAVGIQDGDIAQLLIDRGAKLNGAPRGEPPLIYASRMGYFDMMKFLVERGADVNARYESTARKDGGSHTALAVARTPESREYLISKGAR